MCHAGLSWDRSVVLRLSRCHNDCAAEHTAALARVVSVSGETRAHHAYLFVNQRVNRMRVLVRDGFGLWLCARRLYEGSFTRAGLTHSS